MEEGFALLRKAFAETLIADENTACILCVIETFCTTNVHTYTHTHREMYTEIAVCIS